MGRYLKSRNLCKREGWEFKQLEPIPYSEVLLFLLPCCIMVHNRIEVGEPLIISCVFHPLETLFPFFLIISYATCIILLFIHPKKWNSHPLEPSMSDHQLRLDIVQ